MIKTNQRIRPEKGDAVMFVWFSSNTAINQKGSLMIYRVQNDEVQTWYASFENKDSWQLARTKGIGLHELRQYIK